MRARAANTFAIKTNAYIDVGKSGVNRNGKLFASIDKKQAPNHDPFKKASLALKERANKEEDGEDHDVELDSMHDKIIRELDFDRVIA